MDPIELTQLEAAAVAEVPGPTHRSWRERGLFENSVQAGKGTHSSYALDAVFRGNLLGAMNGWPLTDKEKCAAARWAESGRVAGSRYKGGYKVTRYPDGGRSSVYDENAPTSAPPRFVMVRPGADPLPQSEETLVAAITSLGWPSFLVLDADLLFARAVKAIEKKASGAK